MVLARPITRTTPFKYRNLKLLEENIYTYAFSGLVPSEPNLQRLLGYFFSCLVTYIRLGVSVYHRLTEGTIGALNIAQTITHSASDTNRWYGCWVRGQSKIIVTLLMEEVQTRVVYIHMQIHRIQALIILALYPCFWKTDFDNN